VPIPGEEGKTANGINMHFNQTAELNLSPGFKDQQADGLDTPIWQINQAAMGVWFAATHPPEWRLALNLLYSVVLDGLGRQVLQTAGWTGIYGTVSIFGVGYIFPNLSADQKNRLYYDKDWGFGDLHNYPRYEALSYGSDPM